MKWKWIKKNQTVRPIHAEYDNDEEITDFDLRPYLGWMEGELKNKYG